MIRLRKQNGTTVEMPGDTRFIEITDLKGEVGYVIVLKDGGEVQLFSVRDREMVERYSKAFGVKFCPVISVPESHTKSAV